MHKPKYDPIDREIFVDNRKTRLEEFRSCLTDIKNPFAKQAAQIYLNEQKQFLEQIKKEKHPYTNIKEEQNILDIMLREIKCLQAK
jgi:hypothetical protein